MQTMRNLFISCISMVVGGSIFPVQAGGPQAPTVAEMAKASIRLQVTLAKFEKEIFSNEGRAAANYKERRDLDWKCSQFSQLVFYSKYRNIIDHIDTSPFKNEGDVRPNREDKSVLKDPRKIAVETKYLVDGLAYKKGFHPPADDFAIEYASRPDLLDQCEPYLKASGLDG